MPTQRDGRALRQLREQVLPRLVRERDRRIGDEADGDRSSSRPALRPLGIACLTLSLPVSVVITGIDSLERLDQALSVARETKLLSEEEVAAVLARTAEAAKTGSVEKYKTSHHFDGTAQHPEWLGPRTG